MDINLPGKSGYSICGRLRSKSDFPILVLTSRDTMEDELRSLEIGADDFLTKPCHPDRLLARVERLLRTYENLPRSWKVGDILFDPETYKLMFQGEFVLLSETEGRMMRVFLERPDELITKNELVTALWGEQAYVDENILAVNITRLRKSIDSIGLRDRIRTLRGQGYLLQVSK